MSQSSPAILPDQFALSPAWFPKSQELGLPAYEGTRNSCTMVHTGRRPAADDYKKVLGPHVQPAPLLNWMLTV